MKTKFVSILFVGMLLTMTMSAMALQPKASQANLVGAPLGRGSTAYAYCSYDPSGQIPQGFVTFNTDSPGVIISLSAWLLVFNTMTYDLEGNLYGTVLCDNYTDSGFYQINTTTWNATFIGYVGATVFALTCDPTSDIIYASAGTGDASKLYTIDKITGEGTLIGPYGSSLQYALGLACDENGSTYIIDIATDNFYRVDKTTGVATVIGPTGQPLNYGVSMCYDMATHTLFLSAYTMMGELFTVNRSTGLCTMVGMFQGGMELDALCFRLLAPDNPPVTTITVSGEQQGEVYVSAVTVIITATDTDQTPVAVTNYRLDSGSWITYTAPFVISSPGAHTIQAYSVDTGGLVENPVKNASFIIVAPVNITMTGGFGLTVKVTNTGASAFDITGNIAISGLVFPKNKAISATAVAPGADAITTISLFGVGPLTIHVTANAETKTATGFAFLVFILGVK